MFCIKTDRELFKDMKYLAGLQSAFKDILRPEDISRRIESIILRVRGYVEELAINVSNAAVISEPQVPYPGAISHKQTLWKRFRIQWRK
jgi:hypothetical protein